MTALIAGPPRVVNIGVPAFAEAINASGGAAVDVAWSPPVEGDAALGKALATLAGDPVVAAANQRAFAAYLAAQPALVGVATAIEAVPGVGERTLLHAGPPVDFADMCGPMQGAVVGAILYEGWAGNQAAAMALAAGGGLTFDSCHHHDAVGPMAGVVSPTMPVWVVHDAVHGHTTFAPLNEGLGKVLRFGANNDEVLTRLRWMGETLAPALGRAIDVLGEMDLKTIMAQALHMGDEVHNRNTAASALLLKRLIPGLLRAGVDDTTAAEVVDFIAGNDHFFLNLSMPACKAMLDAAHGVEASTMVTAMARNGVEFGIRLSGTGAHWFTAPAPKVDGLYFPGYGIDDAAGDLGDSAITETAGIGGFAMAAAPAIVKFVGGTPDDAVANSEDMGHITLGRNTAFTLPMLDFAGSPAGIDLVKVLDSGILPVINTGIAHGDAGVGQIGAGVTRAPLACFVKALSFIAAGQ